METFRGIIYSIGQILYIAWTYIKAAATQLWELMKTFTANVIVPMTPTMLKFFSNHTANMIMFGGVIIYFLTMNIAALCMFGSDKKKAKRKEHRISESRLIRVCFWGGAIGGMIGMHLFHHKTLKRKFRILIPIMFVIQLVLQSFVIGFLGFWAFFLRKDWIFVPKYDIIKTKRCFAGSRASLYGADTQCRGVRGTAAECCSD